MKEQTMTTTTDPIERHPLYVMRAECLTPDELREMRLLVRREIRDELHEMRITPCGPRYEKLCRYLMELNQAIDALPHFARMNATEGS